MNLKKILLPLGLLRLSGILNAAEPNTYIPSTPVLDGDINSSWGVDVISDELTIGSTGIFFPNDHKTILTFDTTNIVAGEAIDYAHVVLYFSELPEGMHYGEALEYMYKNLEVEIAGPFGFGGSYNITALGYYSLPVATLDDDKIMYGWFQDVGLNIAEHVNPL